MAKIKAILWDYGNVLVRWAPRNLYEKVIADKQKLEFFLSKVCPLSWHHLHDMGVPMAENIAARQKEFPEFHSEIALWQQEFGQMIGDVFENNIALIHKTKAKGIKQFVLTNMPKEVVQICIDPFPFTNEFDDIIVSGVEKCAKPENKIFEIALARMGGLKPHEVFFIDDSKMNIDAALVLGIHAHLFQNENELQQAMEELGLI